MTVKKKEIEETEESDFEETDIDSDSSVDESSSSDDESNQNENNESEIDCDNEYNLHQDKLISTEELFEIDIANHILKFNNDFKPFMRMTSFEDGYDAMGILKKYILNAKIENSIGFKKVIYKQNNGKGRFFAVGGLSLQSLCREIRHTIAKKYYKDIDVVNCHPVLLQWLCKKNNFNCKFLSKYIANRDKYIKGNPKKKTLFLVMTNEGSKINEDRLSEFELNYWNEMKKLHKLFAKQFPDDFQAHKKKRIVVDKKYYNHEASFMNSLLCDLENKILMCMWKFYDNAKDVVLCFDGIMIRIRADNNYKIKECEKFIEDELGIKITLKIKDMNEGFDLTGRMIDVYNPMEQEKENKYLRILQKIKDCINNNDVNEGTLSLIFVEMMKDDIIVTNDQGGGFQWDATRKLWLEKNTNALMNEIRREDNLILKAIRVVEQEYEQYCKKYKNNKTKEKIGLAKLKSSRFIKKAIQSVREVQNIYKFSQIELFNEKFKTHKINRKHKLLPISNGKIINLKTGEIRNRTKDDQFSLECPVNFIPESLWTDCDKEDIKRFIEQIFIEDREYIDYVQIKFGSYLCGDNCRDIDINHGAGKNGKSCIVKALAIILGDFLGYIGKDVIVFDPKQHRKKGGGNHTSHLIPIDGKRLVVTQELEEGDTLDSEIVKKIASADVIEGVRECYGKKTTQIYPFCKLVVCSNKIPKFEVNDKAIVDRLVFNPFKARFLNKEEFKLEKSRGAYDETKFKYYVADNEFVKKYGESGRNIDILFSWLVQGCIKFYEIYNHGIEKPQIVKDYIENKLAENDIVSLWVSDQCETVIIENWIQMNKKKQKEFQSFRSELYDTFSNWAYENEGIKNYGKIKFYDSLSSKFKCKKTNGEFVYERIRPKKLEHE